MRWLYVLSLSLSALAAETDHSRKVTLMRVPGGGIQPQIAMDAKGAIHLLFYNGDPQHGDLYYARSKDGGATFSTRLRVNSVPGSAIAVGNIRGGHLAIGKNGRVHVAWNGSQGGMRSPMFYARLNDAGTAFGPQRTSSSGPSDSMAEAPSRLMPSVTSTFCGTRSCPGLTGDRKSVV